MTTTRHAVLTANEPLHQSLALFIMEGLIKEQRPLSVGISVCACLATTTGNLRDLHQSFLLQ